MDAELRIGAMGFEEGYVSRVEAEKERWVKVKCWQTVFFLAGEEETDPDPCTGDLQGCEHVPPPVDNMVLLSGTANNASRRTANPRRSLPRLRLCLADPRRRDPDRVGQGQRPDGGKV